VSLFKKLRDKVTPPRVNISLLLKKQIFYLGVNVEGAVQVESQEEFDCTEIRCELECVERVRKTRRVYDASLKREVEQQVWDSAVIFSARPQLAGPLHVPEGFVQSSQL